MFWVMCGNKVTRVSVNSEEGIMKFKSLFKNDNFKHLGKVKITRKSTGEIITKQIEKHKGGVKISTNTKKYKKKKGVSINVGMR
jgi:hypothetical protein